MTKKTLHPTPRKSATPTRAVRMPHAKRGVANGTGASVKGGLPLAGGQTDRTDVGVGGGRHLSLVRFVRVPTFEYGEDTTSCDPYAVLQVSRNVRCCYAPQGGRGGGCCLLLALLSLSLTRHASAGVSLSCCLVGLCVQASLKEVKDAYRELALRFHPDRISAVGRLSLRGVDPAVAFSRINEAYSVLVDEYKRTRFHAMESLLEEDIEKLGAIKRKNAMLDVELMKEALKEIISREWQRQGIIVVRALYGEMPETVDVYRTLREQAVGEVIDVTKPMQYLVRDSKILVPAGSSKVVLKGFYDPVNGYAKVLAIRYLFRRRLHQCVVNDFGRIRMPMRGTCRAVPCRGACGVWCVVFHVRSGAGIAALCSAVVLCSHIVAAFALGLLMFLFVLLTTGHLMPSECQDLAMEEMDTPLPAPPAPVPRSPRFSFLPERFSFMPSSARTPAPPAPPASPRTLSETGKLFASPSLAHSPSHTSQRISVRAHLSPRSDIWRTGPGGTLVFSDRISDANDLERRLNERSSNRCVNCRVVGVVCLVQQVPCGVVGWLCVWLTGFCCVCALSKCVRPRVV